MQLLAHVLEGSCDDPDCELHHMDVAAEEQVATDMHRAAWLAGAEWAINQSRGLRGGGESFLQNYFDELLGEARELATRGL